MAMNTSEDQPYEHHLEPAIPNPQFIPTSPSYFNLVSSKHAHSRPISPGLFSKLQQNDFENENNNPLEPTTWDLKYTVDWLIEYELESFVDLFKDNNIHGESFASLNHKRLRSLGVQSYKERSKLLRTLRTCFPQLETLTIQTDIGKPYSNLNPHNYQPSSVSPLKVPEFLEYPLRNHPQQTNTCVFQTGSHYIEKNLPVISPVSPGLPLDDVSIPFEENFSDPLDIEPPLVFDFKPEEKVSEPSGPIIPEDSFIEESFSDPLAVEAPFVIPDDFIIEESFPDSLGVHALEIIPEIDFEVSFSDPLDLEPPPVANANLKDAIALEIQDQLLPLQSGPFALASSNGNSVYSNSLASISAPSLSSWGDNGIKSSLAHGQVGEISPLEPSESHDSSFDVASLANTKNTILDQGLQPIIKPRKESMINLEKPWKGGFVPRSPTHRDAILSSQRRSSLFYDSDPSKRLEFHSRKMESSHTFPREAKTIDPPGPRRGTSKLKPSANESSFFGNLLPDFFKPFSKHNRKLSCPDNMKFDKNKVIQVSLEDSGAYSVNIGGCTGAEEISATIFSSLLLDKESHEYHIEEILADGTTRLVSSRQLLALCSKTDNKGLVRFMLRRLRKAQEPRHPIISSEARSVPATEVPKEPAVPSWAQMWGERPSMEMISSNLEQFFPNHDLDSPILDQSPETPFETLGRKKSIRMVVEEAVHRRLSSRLFRRSTKLWGSRITQLKDDMESPNQEDFHLSEELLNLQAKTQIKWIKGKGIGKGSFGRVFHALNAATGEMLAVKVIDLPSPNIGRKRGDMIKELYREIELLKDLDHDNIVQYLGFEASNESINIFLEYVSGGSINSVLMRSGPFDELYASSLIRQTVKGLSYLHSCNILHRDIKAANVLINHEGVCKISDFGISKRNDYALAYRYNSRMSFKGSVFWMAPEVIIDHGYSAKVDIWSLGCLLIEMLTGTRPWKELNELATVYRLGKSTSESAPPIPPGISPMTKAFLGQCFIIEPESRPTAEQLLEHDYFRNGPRKELKSLNNAEEPEDQSNPAQPLLDTMNMEGPLLPQDSA